MIKTLFLPGAGGSSKFWQPVANQVSPNAKLISWPGLGDEPHSINVSGIEDLVNIVQSNIDTPVNLVAQSMGGVVAIETALRNPEKVRRLVLVVTAAGVPIDDLGAADWRVEYRQTFPNAAKWVEEFNVDFSEQLKTLQIPTLLIWGDSDPISPVAVGQRIDELMPNSKLFVVKGGGHSLGHTHAAEISPAINKHIE